MKRFVSGILSCVFATVVFMFCAMGVANAVTYPFSVTTTSSTSRLSFSLSAAGTFNVDCGTGGTLSSTASDVSGKIITRTGTTDTTYTCTWSYANARTVKFSGTATDYNTSMQIAAISFMGGSSDEANKIASISGDLSEIFPYISENPADGAQPRFAGTFSNANNLKSIPATLFSGYTSAATAMFSSTFSNTGITAIPENLFFPNAVSVPAQQSLFVATFLNCTSLASIPAGLFAKITGGAAGAFGNTFYGCSKLTSLPDGLFANITVGAINEFVSTFEGCSKLSGYIPATFFAGITPRGSNTTSTMVRTFANTRLSTSCPSGTQKYTTGWESYWNSKVLCVKKYNISYVMNSGTNYSGAPTQYYELTGATVGGTPTKSGSVFAGWCTDAELQNCAMSQTIGTSATGDKTFYAKWINTDAETYNVTYACGDGTGTAPTDSTEYISDESVTTLSNTCSKTNSVFTNWSCGGTNVAAGGTFTITDDTTCTAQWSECQACAATNASCSLSVVNNVCTYTTSCNTGYGNIQNNGAYNVSCSEVDFYNVTYACGDGTGTAPTDSTEYISDESVTTLSNTCSKTNSVFTNWSCGGNTVAAGGTFTITDDTTCTAQWSSCTQCAATNASCSLSVVNNVCTYTTSCNTGYGDIQNNGQYNASCSANDITLVYHDEEGNEISTGSCEYGTTISLPDAPAKQGYKFKGWTVVPAE